MGELQPETSYCFKLEAVRDDQVSPQSPEQCATTAVAPPASVSPSPSADATASSRECGSRAGRRPLKRRPVRPSPAAPGNHPAVLSSSRRVAAMAERQRSERQCRGQYGSHRAHRRRRDQPGGGATSGAATGTGTPGAGVIHPQPVRQRHLHHPGCGLGVRGPGGGNPAAIRRGRDPGIGPALQGLSAIAADRRAIRRWIPIWCTSDRSAHWPTPRRGARRRRRSVRSASRSRPSPGG